MGVGVGVVAVAAAAVVGVVVVEAVVRDCIAGRRYQAAAAAVFGDAMLRGWACQVPLGKASVWMFCASFDVWQVRLRRRSMHISS